MPCKVIVAGSVNMDIVATALRHPVPGETISGESLRFLPGGKGANQAVAAARLGANVQLIARVGDDVFADSLLEFLRADKIDSIMVERTAGCSSGTALIMVSKAGENMIVVVPGANGRLSPSDISQVSITSDTVCVTQLETPPETVESFLSLCKKAGGRSILNPTPACPAGMALLPRADFVLLNQTELAYYAGATEQDTVDESRLAELITALACDPSQTVIVTLGALGAIARHAGRMLRTQGRVVNVVDTTGAGDCFAGALAASITMGKSVEDSMNYASDAASLSVQRRGAAPSMPYATELSTL